MADGVIFPIISAMPYFVELDKKGRWKLHSPKFFDAHEMIDAARDQLSAHNGNPMLMGRNAAVYEALALLTKMVLRVANRVNA